MLSLTSRWSFEIPVDAEVADDVEYIVDVGVNVVAVVVAVAEVTVCVIA